MKLEVPQAVKDNAAWSLVTFMGFLFAFWINSTVVFADDMKAYQSEMRWVIEVDGLQDELSDYRQEIRRLKLYIREAPESTLNNARLAEIDMLEAEIQDIEQELEQLMEQAP